MDGKKTVLGTGSAGRVTDRRKLFRRLVALAGLGITGVLLSQKEGLLPPVEATCTSSTICYTNSANSTNTIEGDASGTNGVGVYGSASGTGGLGVSGYGADCGVYGKGSSTVSVGVAGDGWTGVSGYSKTNVGVAGFSAGTTNGIGVSGAAGGGGPPGVYVPVGVVGYAGAASAIPLVAQAYAVGQTANLQEWQNPPNTALSAVTASGWLGIGTATPLNSLDVVGAVAVGTYAGVNTAPSNGLIVSGSVGIGTSTPAYPLDIASSSLVPFRVSASAAWPGFLMVGGTSASGMNGMMIQNSTGQQYNLGIGGHTNSAVPDTFFIYDNNSTRMVLTVTPSDYVGIGTQTPTHLLQLGGGAYCDGSGAWIAGSSIRWKENITPLTGGVETLKQLHPVAYNRKETPGKTTMGFIAEEVGKVLPTVVDWDPKEAGYAEGYDHLAILALAVESVKEQQRTIEQQQRIIERHEAENNTLRDRLENQQQRIVVLERKLAAS